MKVTWLGQAGLLFENEAIKIIIDPYLSDACGKKNPKSYRRVPVDERFLEIVPDVIVLTHDHLDHTDMETLPHYLGADTHVTVLASPNAWERVRTLGGGNNYVLFDRFTEWTQNGVRFSAVKAAHSDRNAIGVIIDDGEKKYYVTGDTLYSKAIFEDLPSDLDTVFLPINGVGNNMNAEDASRFADATGAKNAVPLHFGMFDEKNADAFCACGKVVPKIYELICLK